MTYQEIKRFAIWLSFGLIIVTALNIALVIDSQYTKHDLRNAVYVANQSATTAERAFNQSEINTYKIQEHVYDLANHTNQSKSLEELFVNHTEATKKGVGILVKQFEEINKTTLQPTYNNTEEINKTMGLMPKQQQQIKPVGSTTTAK